MTTKRMSNRGRSRSLSLGYRMIPVEQVEARVVLDKITYPNGCSSVVLGLLGEAIPSAAECEVNRRNWSIVLTARGLTPEKVWRDSDGGSYTPHDVAESFHGKTGVVVMGGPNWGHTARIVNGTLQDWGIVSGRTVHNLQLWV